MTCSIPPDRVSSGRRQQTNVRWEVGVRPEKDPITRASATGVDKPWGFEVRWAVTDRYVGKLLHICEGHALPRKYHEHRDESILLMGGLLDLDLGEVTYRLSPGDCIRIVPGTPHRMKAIEDCDIFQVSSPELYDEVHLDEPPL
jgi:quercetin dioxygenase-like cupin family protein